MKSQSLITLAVILSLCLLTACALMRSNESGVRLAVQYATAKVVDGDPTKADKVMEIAARAREHVTGPTSATVSQLDAVVRAQIPWDSLDMADRLLVDALLLELRDELARRLGDGVLNDTQRLQVAAVITWIERAAQLAQ